MTGEPKRRETDEEWAARMVREHGPVPLRISRRLAHIRQQQVQAKHSATQGTGH